MWGLLGLAGLGEADWTPQYAYWKRPEKNGRRWCKPA